MAEDLYTLLEKVRWLSELGNGTRPAFAFPAQVVESRAEAIAGFTSELWADAKTEAQGDLTGYLAKRRNDLYASYWNSLVRQSRDDLEKRIKGVVGAALIANGLPDDWVEAILLDLNRAAVEVAFRRQVPGAPAFFERLVRVYEAGRLPCGWSGDLDGWPAGEILIF
jgi:hypothetical protein